MNVIPIVVPVLRDRKDDIPLLVEHFLEVFNKSRRKQIEGIEDQVMDCLVNYRWPGNVRELENLIDRMVVLDRDGVIRSDDLPEKIRDSTASLRGRRNLNEVDTHASDFSFESAVTEFEKGLIQNALEQAGWVKNRAAKLLNMKRTTLVEKMKKSQLDKPSSA